MRENQILPYCQGVEYRIREHNQARTVGLLVVSHSVFMPSVYNTGSDTIGTVRVGTGVLIIDEEQLTLRPDQEFFIPRGARHFIDPRSDQTRDLRIAVEHVPGFNPASIVKSRPTDTVATGTLL